MRSNTDGGTGAFPLLCLPANPSERNAHGPQPGPKPSLEVDLDLRRRRPGRLDRGQQRVGADRPGTRLPGNRQECLPRQRCEIAGEGDQADLHEQRGCGRRQRRDGCAGTGWCDRAAGPGGAERGFHWPAGPGGACRAQRSDRPHRSNRAYGCDRRPGPCWRKRRDRCDRSSGSDGAAGTDRHDWRYRPAGSAGRQRCHWCDRRPRSDWSSGSRWRKRCHGCRRSDWPRRR